MRIVPPQTTWYQKFIAALVTSLLLAGLLQSTQARPVDALGSFDNQLLELINNHRRSKGLQPFVEYGPLSAASQAWSANMANRSTATNCSGSGYIHLQHDSPANIGSQGVPPGTSASGENIAYSCGYPGTRFGVSWSYSAMPAVCAGSIDYTTALLQFCQWIDSSGHRSALESSSFTHIGLGTAVRQGSDGSRMPFSTARFVRAPIAPSGPTCNGLEVTVDMNTGQGSPTEGRDVILGTPRADWIWALGGDDVICGGAGIDRIRSGAGNDVVFGEGGSDRIFGDAGADVLHGGSGADRIYGGPANDVIFGNGGQDFLSGGDGNDEVQGNWESDTIRGGAGNDVLRGAGGKDAIYGEVGDDRLYGGRNTDYLNGGAGRDFGDGQKGRDNPVAPPVSGCERLETRVSC